MKKLCLCLVLVLGVVASGCDSQEKAGGASRLGTEQGNGMTSYSNDKLQVSFVYPAAWSLQESVDREEVSLSNVSLAPNGPPSLINFKRLKELGGRRVFSVDELKAVLEKIYPKQSWKPAEFVGHRKGFVSRAIEKGASVTKAEYYVLDENYNILFVSFNAAPELGGEDIVYAVIGSVVIDLDPPEVFAISMSPTEARPGDEVTVTIVAIDDASGIDSQFFKAPLVDLSNLEQNWLGYQVKHFPYDIQYKSDTIPEAPWMRKIGPGLSRAYEPAAALPFRSPWERITKVRYIYRFRMPKGAPTGRVVLANVSLRDLRGNGVVYTLEPATSEGKLAPVSYMANYQIRRQTIGGKPYRANSPLIASGIEVVGGSTSSEKGGIEVRDLFWDTSVLPVGVSGNATTSLYARLESPGEVVAAFTDAPKVLGSSCVINEYYFDEQLSWQPHLDGTHPILSTPSPGLLRMERSINPGQPQCGGAWRSSTAFLRRIYLRDDLGNIVSLTQEKPNSFEGGDLQLPYLRKPVLFQMTW